MKWSMDTHKYMSEITRTALKIIAENNVTSESSMSEIDAVERKLVDAGVYRDYDSAKGRIRRALFTYFKAYGCMQDNESLTEMGKAFVDNKISIQEFSFWYVLNYEYTNDGFSYYPAHLILKCLKMLGNFGEEQAYISAHDFSHLVECESIDDVSDEFVNSLLSLRQNTAEPVNERRIGFDIWAKMFVQAGILNRTPQRNLTVRDPALLDWILTSYDKGINVTKGKISTGVFEYLPIPTLGSSHGEVHQFKDESAALQAFLFDNVEEQIINKYILRNNEVSFSEMKATLGLKDIHASFYKNYSGLEHLVGYTLINNNSTTIKTIGEILISVELSEESLDEIGGMQLDFDYDKIERIEGGANILLYGVPGSGKSWTIEHEYCKKDSNVERLVFHPDYTYSDFIGQILPDVSEDEQVSYKFTPGPFTTILHDAYVNPQKEYILIIEEINRGNAPAIFGEVFQLLDRKVRIKDDGDDGFPIGTSEYGITNKNIALEVYGNARKKVRIPSNLSIIGTMNTSDQNVFTLDTAFQRRWEMRMIENSFDRVDSNFANAEILDTTVTWKSFCISINDIIVGNNARMTSAEDKRLGAYFVQLRDLKYNDAAEDKTEGEYVNLCNKEKEATLTPEEKIRLDEIRGAMKQNRRFPEKVIKYLWDDAFKFSREVIFETSEYQSLEAVIRKFMQAKKFERFVIFKENVRGAFMNQNSTEQN